MWDEEKTIMKLSDFLKQQGDTPQGKSTYQAFIDNFEFQYNSCVGSRQ